MHYIYYIIYIYVLYIYYIYMCEKEQGRGLLEGLEGGKGKRKDVIIHNLKK